MMDEEIYALFLQHTPHVARATIPLMTHFPGRPHPEPYGSGVLLRIGDWSFILTAAHVTDDAKRLLTVVPVPTADQSPLPLQRFRLAESTMPASGSRDDDPFDVAIIGLEPSVADTLATYTRFLSLDDLLPHFESAPPAEYAILGYPYLRSEIDSDQRLIVSQILPYFTELYEHDRAPVQINPKVDIWMNLQKPGPRAKDYVGFQLATPAGMSGCGMWRVKDAGTPLQSLDWRKWKLIGVVHYWDPSAEVIKGTKIQYVLRLLWTHWPEVRPIIEERFPLPSLL